MNQISFLVGQKQVYAQGDVGVMMQDLTSKVDKQKQKTEITEVTLKDAINRINQLEERVKNLEALLGYFLLLVMNLKSSKTY